ncbi:hypothetical protein ABVF11_01510 [Pediococcus argentinicus]|uniref:hypothetical protein n=1 Tax=Pediococcus argentinicus TaxID=480391 RepID=UPI00338FCEAE
MKYIKTVNDWLNQDRHFGQEAGISMGFLAILLVLYKLLTGIFTKVPFISWRAIIGVLLIFALIIGIFRIVEMRRK